MELIDFLKLTRTKRSTITSMVILFVFVALTVTFVQPLKYVSSAKLLVVQEYGVNTDPYIAAKSNDYLSNILAQVVSSKSFFDEVLNAGFNIDKNYFPSRPDKRLEEWDKTVNAKIVNDTGMINIEVYHPDKYQTDQIAQAINYVLKTKNNQYHGGGDKVNVKIINDPIVSRWPLKPNIILNLALGIILGFICGLYYIYLFPDEKYDFNLFRRGAKKKLKSFIPNQVQPANFNQNYSRPNPQNIPNNNLRNEPLINKPEIRLHMPATPNQQPIQERPLVHGQVIRNDFRNNQKTNYDKIVKGGDMKNVIN